jgi:hypothetical protein
MEPSPGGVLCIQRCSGVSRSAQWGTAGKTTAGLIRLAANGPYPHHHRAARWHGCDSYWYWALMLGATAIFGELQAGLNLYTGHASVGSAYGAAGSLVVLLVWVYYSSLLFCFGAKYTHAWATRQHAVAPEPYAAPGAVPQQKGAAAAHVSEPQQWPHMQERPWLCSLSRYAPQRLPHAPSAQSSMATGGAALPHSRQGRQNVLHPCGLQSAMAYGRVLGGKDSGQWDGGWAYCFCALG